MNGCSSLTLGNTMVYCDIFGNVCNRIVSSVGGATCFINNHWLLPFTKSINSLTILTKFQNY